MCYILFDVVWTGLAWLCFVLTLRLAGAYSTDGVEVEAIVERDTESDGGHVKKDFGHKYYQIYCGFGVIFCLVSIGLIWFGLVVSCCFGLVRFGSVRFGSVRFGSVRFGSVRFGSVRFGSVRFGLIVTLTQAYGMV